MGPKLISQYAGCHEIAAEIHTARLIFEQFSQLEGVCSQTKDFTHGLRRSKFHSPDDALAEA